MEKKFDKLQKFCQFFKGQIGNFIFEYLLNIIEENQKCDFNICKHRDLSGFYDIFIDEKLLLRVRENVIIFKGNGKHGKKKTTNIVSY